jgi:AcrR family transcriptional regulator
MAIRKQKTQKSSTNKAEKKRTEILKAATKCFRKTCFHQTSMQEICAETGLGPEAVYRYFDSKDSIIDAMADEKRRQARAILQDLQLADHLPDALAGVALAFAERYTAVSDVSLMTEVYAEGLRNKRVGNVIKNRNRLGKRTGRLAAQSSGARPCGSGTRCAPYCSDAYVNMGWNDYSPGLPCGRRATGTAGVFRRDA